MDRRFNPQFLVAQTILSPSFVRGACVLQNPKIPSSFWVSQKFGRYGVKHSYVALSSMPELRRRISCTNDKIRIYALSDNVLGLCFSFELILLTLPEPDLPGLSLSEGMARDARAPFLLGFVLG